MSEDFQFPAHFIWGAATAAYQIEGSPLADGAGPSIWQRFCHTPGMTVNGHTGDVACDHYKRFKDDVRLMKQLGLQTYRFSISWSRVLPEGRGRVNPAGLGFYSQLVDELIANGIEPNATLFHWDLPAALDDLGGWLNPEIANWFADYAEVMFRALDGRVKMWSTLNEPWVVTDGGYLFGALAPGHRNLYETPIASRNLMRAHGAAVKRYREVGQHRIGLVVNIEPKYAATASALDLAATERANAYMNQQYLDAALLGTQPPEMNTIFGDAWTPWSPEDHALAKQPLDFIGINYYTRSVTQHDETRWPVKAAAVRQDATITETGWEVYPQGLIDLLDQVKARYGAMPIYITENGSAFYDPPHVEGDRLDDPLRTHYLWLHLRAIHAAIQKGHDVRGYYAWSLMDNLEWSLGYTKRFGLYHVDFTSQKRTAKATAHYYANVIATHGASLAAPVSHALPTLPKTPAPGLADKANS